MPPSTANFSKEIIRPNDLLHLTFDFHNLALKSKSGGLELVRAKTGNAYIVVTFPPQSFGEESFFEVAAVPPSSNDPDAASVGEDPTKPPIQALISGKSWLVFRVPDAALPITYSLAGLLQALSRCEVMSQDHIGQPPESPPGPSDQLNPAIEGTFTSIEAPFRLILSPDGSTGWMHSGEPATDESKSRVELWHTRLGKMTNQPGTIDETGAPPPTARAVWSRNFNSKSPLPKHSNQPFRMPLDDRDRSEIVLLSTGDATLVPNYTPKPIQVEQLILSALGAWLKAHGEWSPPTNQVVPGSDFKLTVQEWRHLMTMGRDHFVRVVYAGYLFPFGHRASLVKITERKFQPAPDTSESTAYLRTRMFIIVRQTEKEFTHRSLPFKSVTFKTLVTPNIADPENPPCVIIPGQKAFWIRAFNVSDNQVEDFQFHLAAVDHQDRTIEFSAPLIFVSSDISSAQVDGTVVPHYRADARSTCALGGQSLAFAPPNQPNDTSFEATSLSFNADGTISSPDGVPNFVPTLRQAQVDIPAVKQLLGKSFPSTVQWESTYTQATGTDIGNPGDVFLKIMPAAQLEFDVQKSGGLLTPNLKIGALSRAFGPINTEAITGSFPSKTLFPDIQILGGINLKDILNDMNFQSALGAGTQIPNLKTTRITNEQGIEVNRATYAWSVNKISPMGDSLLLDTGLFSPRDGSAFSLQTIVDQPLDGSSPTMSVMGALTNFDVLLIPTPDTLKLVKLQFNSITFTAKNDQKVDVAVNFQGMQFLGILEFVNALSKVIPVDGFNDPPYLDVIPPPDDRAGINVGYTLAIPDVGVGAFTLQNISLSSGFYLPFIGKPMNLHFAFCKREQPFILTVYAIGGGGFVGLDVGLGGVTMLEASLEFGASVELNLGVASGAAMIMGGFYYQMAGNGFTISAFIRAAGELEVLGIISVSIEFYLALTYTSKSPGVPHAGKLYGQASLSIEISILFFSKTVSVSMEREIAGSDPKFIDQYSQADWAEYCSKFDDYPAVEVI